jgi:hypothetical protein
MKFEHQSLVSKRSQQKISAHSASMQSDRAVPKSAHQELFRTSLLDSIDPLQAENRFTSVKQGESIPLGKFEISREFSPVKFLRYLAGKSQDCFSSLRHQVLRLIFNASAPSSEIDFQCFGTKF